jgi:predicted DNA-binding transcriptional regulator AlpA
MRQKRNESERQEPCEPMLTVEDLERLLKVTRRTIARLCLTGRLPRPVKVGGRNRWRTSDLREYLRGLA